MYAVIYDNKIDAMFKFKQEALMYAQGKFRNQCLIEEVYVKVFKEIDAEETDYVPVDNSIQR